MDRLRVGVIGCGIVSQVMHLPYLRELRDRYDLRALCDVSPGTLGLVADAYGVSRRFTDWRDMLGEELDAVFVATNGSHAGPAIAAARSGRHVFVEKPLCFTLDEADGMIAAADEHGVRLMVGYMKRYDPGFVAASERIGAMRDVRFLRLTTLEAPADDYLAPYPILRSADVPPELLASFAEERATLVRRAIGSAPGPDLQRAYIETLLDSAIHELNMLRALAGDPVEVSVAEFWDAGRSLHVLFTFAGELRAALSWLTLPELRRYRQEIACYAPAERVTVSFPAPYLRNAPTPVLVEDQDAASTWAREVVTSYDEAFRRELVHFHDAVVRGTPVLTDARDARRDIELAVAIVRGAVTRAPVPMPGAGAPAPVSGAAGAPAGSPP